MYAGAWTQNVILSETSSSPSISMGNDGFARIAYTDNTNQLNYLQCTNTSCTSFNRTQTGILVSNGARIIQGEDGLSRIITSIDFDSLDIITCTNAACSTNTVVTIDTSASQYANTAARYGSDGFLRILVTDNTNGRALFITCTNTDCSSKTTTIIYNDFPTGSYMDLASDNTARIVYGDYTNANLYLLVCSNNLCSSSSSTTLDTGDPIDELVPEALNVELGSDGFARIAYFMSYDFKFIQCLNADCSSKTISQIPNSLQGNNQLSLKLTTTNLAKISYREFSQSDMKFVACSNASCSSATITLIDGAASNSGAFNDMVLGSFEEGYIAFTDSDNNYLHFAYEAPDPTPTPTATPTPTPTSVPTATPTPTLGPPGPQATIIGSTTNTPICNESDLNETPDLFQITTSKTTATLYFSPISDIRKYYVSYGTTEGAEQYGAEFEYGDPSGVLSYSVNMLSPNQTYYFKVRGGRGCKAGTWGNVMKAKTTSGNTKQVFYKNFLTQVLSAFTNSTANAQTNTVLSASTKLKSCSYIVELGDSLWSIAQSAYSNGDLYTKLMKLNNLKDTTIHPGQKLKTC